MCKFTGKERDSETGLDYFGARYYGSTMGRWMSPDWSDKPVAAPYVDMTDPQTLNMFAFTRNSPVSRVDKDGHCIDGVFTVACVVTVAAVASAVYGAYKAGRAAYDSVKKAQNDNETFVDDVIKGRVNVDSRLKQNTDANNDAMVDTVKAGTQLNTALNAVAELPNSSTEAPSLADSVVKTASDVIDAVRDKLSDLLDLNAPSEKSKKENKEGKACQEDQCVSSGSERKNH